MSDKDTLKTALERFEQAEGATSEWRQLATEDLKFCANEQWDPQARLVREQTGRPCLTSDHISPAIRQIVNESRQNRPSIEVDPKNNGASVETAKIIAGLIRDIEYQSSADIAYDTSEEYAVKIGLGYYRLISDYEDPESFDQVLRIKLIDDPMSVYLDPDHHEVDGSDVEWGFIVKDIPKEVYLRTYPGTELAKIAAWGTRNTSAAGWIKKDLVRIAEYFYKIYEENTIYHVAIFADNALGEKQFVTERVTFDKPSQDELDRQEVVILNTRVSQKVTVKWDVLNGHEIISSTEWPGTHIPIFPVKGEEFWVDGKRYICGAVRRARDTQRIINFMISNQVEAIDLSNKVPYIGAAGQFDTFEERWRTANQQNYGYLEYNQVDIDGHPASAPTRQAVETPIAAISQTRAQSVDDMKAIFGIYEAAQGANGNETSGVAIIARKQQSSNSNFHFYDNLVRSIKHLGKVLVEVIPTYYDTARTIRIVQPNGKQELVAINGLVQQGKKRHDLTVGLYDVIVKTGPTYATKRAEMVEHGTSLVAQYPAAGPLIADLLVAASDFDGSQEIAARLRTQVPPEVLAATGESDTSGQDPKSLIAGLQGQVAQGQKSLQALNAHAEQVEGQLKQALEDLKNQKAKADADLQKATMDYDISAQQLKLDESVAELDFLSKQQSFELQKEQLELNKSMIQIKAVGEASKIADKQHETENAYLDKSRDLTINTISQVKPLPEIPIGANTNPRIGGKFTG